MRLFMETEGTIELTEIFDFEIEGKVPDPKLQETARAILKLEFFVGEKFEYVAIANAAGATYIRYLQSRKACDPWNQGRKQTIEKNIGYFVGFFQATMVAPEKIPEIIKDQALRNWIGMGEDALREISNLVSSH